jgi:hypothetical protein
MAETMQPWAAEILEPAKPADPTKPPPGTSGEKPDTAVDPARSWAEAMKQVGPNAGVA